MAVKKATVKKVAKKAPAKKAAAKKVATKSVAKKAAVKKVAKKAPVKKAVAKKAVVKKTSVKKAAVKKAATKKAPAKKVAPVTRKPRISIDALATIPEVPSGVKSLSGVETRQPRIAPSAPTIATPEIHEEKKSRPKGFIIFLLLLLIGVGAYFFFGTNGDSLSTTAPKPVTTPTTASTPNTSVTPEASPSESVAVEATETAAPQASQAPSSAPATGSVSSSFTYTSTGIRLAWNVNGADVKSIRVLSSEDAAPYSLLSSVGSSDSSLRITKIDTKGWTKFRVVVTPVEGETFSSTVGLRGRFTL